MAGLTIHLLGSFDLHDDGGRREPPAGAKALELLCYLLLHRDRPAPRTGLVDLLWTDHDTAHGLKQLRQALWQLQSACGRTDGETDGLCLEITQRSITLRSDGGLQLDVAEFEQVFERVRGPASRTLTAEDAAGADRAISLYRGDLLEGFDFDWCLVEREWLHSAYLTMLDRLMIYSERTGEYELGIDYGERILRVDRAREYTHRRMMYLHALLGNRTGALRQFDRCAAALMEELDVLPARATAQLRDLIRTGAELPPRTPHHTADLTAAATPQDAPLERLRRIQRALFDMQSQIQSEFRAIELDARR